MNGTRITTSAVHRRYVTGLHKNFERKNDAENRIISQRKYTRASQSPFEAAKALRNRKAISDSETYLKNLEAAANIYDSAEEAVRGISGLLQTLEEKLIQGAHGTYNVKDDKQIIAEEVEGIADSMVRLMNLITADRRIFGGVNNTTQAYKTNNGVVYYNGVDVNRYSDKTLFPYSTTSYIDAGLGMKFLDEYTIDPQTAVPVTFNGAEILGCGQSGKAYSLDLNKLDVGQTYDIDFILGQVKHTLSFTPATMPDPANPGDTIVDKTATAANINNLLTSSFGPGRVTMLDSGLFRVGGSVSTKNELSVESSSSSTTIAPVTSWASGFPNNVIQLTLDSAKSIRAGTDDLTALYADLVFAASSSVSLSIASIGTQQKFIEFNIERLTSGMYGLKERENQLEYADMGEEMTYQKVLEMIYNATLQMSTQTIPMSIFNFMH